MSLKVRFKFDGKCPDHPRYNPEKDGMVKQLHGMQPCATCDDLWCIHLYTKIAAGRAEHARTVKSGTQYDFDAKPVAVEKNGVTVNRPAEITPTRNKKSQEKKTA